MPLLSQFIFSFKEVEAQVRVFCKLIGTLGASLLGNLLTCKELKLTKASNHTQGNIPGQEVMRAGE